MFEVGTYGEGSGGWQSWVATPEWISFVRDGEVHTYAREESGAVKGLPCILKF